MGIYLINTFDWVSGASETKKNQAKKGFWTPISSSFPYSMVLYGFK